MFLPYRAKNPPERFPYVTISLIVVNCLVYLATIDYSSVGMAMLGGIRDDVVQSFAVSHATLSPLRLFTAMFLHENIFHIAGNMLFLWIFGAALEGRLGPSRYLGLYLFAGLTGGLLHDLMVGVGRPDQMSLGASGAIMGVLGAYLYVFPFSTIRCAYYWGWWWRGVTEWQARWVVLMYVGTDALEAFLFRGMDGVGHFAHLGGAAMGLLSAFLLGVPRDGEEYSNVQAVVADTRDISLLNLYDLEALMQKPNPEPRVILTYCDKALTTSVGGGEQKCLAALQHHGRLLGDQADPVELANVLLRLSLPTAKGIPMIFYLHLGSRLERIASNELAVRVYYLIGEINPQSTDYEAALVRLAHLAQQAYGDQEMAKGFYQEIMERFPNGQMAGEAHRALSQMTRPAPRPSPAS